MAFGFPLRTLMVPVEEGQRVRPPGASRKQFTFVDAAGNEVWTTASVPDPDNTN